MHYHFGYPFNPTRAVLPSAPQNLRVTASDDTSITLEWDASTEGDFPISNYKLVANNIVIATPVGTSFIYDAVPPNESVIYRVQAVDSDGNAGPWSDSLAYENVVDSDDAPIYLMTEPLVNDGSFDYLFNSALSGTKWDAKLLTSGDTAWNPDSAQYPEDGTIDFSGGNKADTQWEAPQDQEWTMSGIYNVEMGVSYDMYSIHYKGNQTCDIYLGSSTEDLVLSESDKDYTPPTGNWIIEEEPPVIIFPVTNPNLIPEGHFTDASTLDVWTANVGAVSIDTERMRVENTIADACEIFRDVISVEQGVEYIFSYDATDGNNPPYVAIGSIHNEADYAYNVTADNGLASATFTTTGTEVHLKASTGTNTTGRFAFLDNMTLYKT